MARVYVLSGHDLGKSFEVTSGSVLGRASECDVPLRDASISRNHAKIEWAKGAWSVVDLNSRNGVMVNGAKVPLAELTEGTEFKLGEVLLRFRAHAVVQETAPAPAPAATPPAAGPVETTRAPSKPSLAPEPDEILLEGEWDASAPASAPPKPAGLPASPTQPTMFTPRSSVPRADANAASSSPAREMPPAPREAPAMREAPSLRDAPSPRAASSGPALTSSGPLIEPRGPTSGVKTTIGARTTQTGGIERKDRGVLQYNKVEHRAGMFQSDLSQQPIYVKFGVWLLALAVFAAVVWGAFHATTFFKQKVESGAEQGEEQEAR